MICPNCKAENRDGAKFCDECGTRLPVPADVEPQDAGEGPCGGQAAEGPCGEEPAEGGDEAPRGLDIPSIEVAGLNADESGEAFDPAAAYLDPSAPADPAAADREGAAPLDDATGSRQDGPAGDEPAGDAAPAPAPEAPADPERAPEPDGAEPSDPGRTAVIGARSDAPASEASQTRRIDLSGFDEYLPEGSYTPPVPSWRDGGTMRLPRIEGEPAASDQKSFLAPEGEPKRSRKGLKIALGIVAALALCAAIAAFATYQMELWGGKVVPDVVGMTQADATNTLETKGFAVRATQVKSDETEGIVLLMDPGKGGRLPEGGEVVIHVAVSRCVPEVVGLSKEEAEGAFDDEGLDNVSFTTQKSDEAEGTVLSVDPEEGQKVRAGTAIAVVVAEPYRIPDVSGMTVDQATAAVQDAGFAPYVQYSYTEDVAEGTVLGTSPGPGEVAASGSDVAVQVAKSRANELVAATQGLLAPGASVVIGGVNYDVDSCDAVSYVGSDTTSYTITARPFTYFLGVKLHLEATSLSGTIAWTADNAIAGGDPEISLG